MDHFITPKDRINLNTITHTVRTAQAVLQYGVGAMVDFPDQTLMTAAPEYWDDRIIRIHDERLEKALNVDYFGMPGGKDEYPSGISYVRFPKWYFCPKCRRFQPIEIWMNEYQRKASDKQKERDQYMKKPKCIECNKDLVVTRLVVACPDGHIDDFPWVQWVHDKNSGGRKQVCQHPVLTFGTGATAAAGLEGLVIRCNTCKARATLYGAFDKDVFRKMGVDYHCTGNQPWKNQVVSCGNENVRTVQRGASSVYYPKVVSSLVIPPYSDKINMLIETSDEFKACLIRIADYDKDERDQRIKHRLDEWAGRIAIQTAMEKETVRVVLERRWLGKEEADDYGTDGLRYRVEEYKALAGVVASNKFSSNDFVRESMDAQDYDIPGLSRIVLVHKVREVRALTGFTRMNPPGSADLGQGISGFVSVKEPQTRWYPAYEVRGEGMFLEFDSDFINEWVSTQPLVLKRANEINSNYAKTYQSQFFQRMITPKYILLHTIAHLLIKQLSFECGYTAASLRERIYCCESPSDGTVMSGMFIYTASGDSEGTLGGIVRQGHSDCLPRIFKKALEAARICSNDPVCISSSGQGRDSLNLGACHACSLLPETSCEDYNVFLDRGLVVGTFENSSIGLFSSWVIDKL